MFPHTYPSKKIKVDSKDMESSYYLPINGMDSLVSGIFSAMANMKTEKARMTVTPRAIFSPESGGIQKTSTVSVDIIMQGNTMLYM